MVNYKVVKYTAEISDPGNLKADILEVNTGYTIGTNIPVQEARDTCRHLNFGGGFDGWTPAFFLEKREKYVFWSEEDA